MPTNHPIDSLLPDLVAVLRQHPAAVLEAPTGAGKTTQVPPALLSGGFAESGRVVMLEPRRLAARAAAQRIAHERGCQLGADVGYHVRFDRQASPSTRLLVVTPGILLQELLRNPYLDQTSLVVFDEFHERGLESDLALGLVKLLQATVRPELKLLVMSATLATQRISEYLGGAPVLRSEGRVFPVEVRYLPRPERDPLVPSVVKAALGAWTETPGDVLAFLPGVGEIRQAERLLRDRLDDRDGIVLPLFGDLSLSEQAKVLEPSPRRKLVLATNVAETSVTIPNVTAVVDSGLVRELRYDQSVGLDRLNLVPISQASAQQRAGRAGRTRRGLCLRLWREADHAGRPPETTPEVQRIDLSAAMLQLMALGETDPLKFPWLDAPRLEVCQQALRLLELLGAVVDGAVTELGQALARTPLPPRLGRLLAEGTIIRQGQRAALAAALLAERSPFLRPERGWKPSPCGSDLLEQVEALEVFAEQGTLRFGCGALDAQAAHQVLRVREHLLRGQAVVRPDPPNDEAFQKLLLAAFPDRVARRREKGSQRAVLLDGRGIRLADSSGVREAELFLALEIQAAEPEALVRTASAIQRDWLPPQLITNTIEVEFDAKAEQVVALKRLRYQQLLLEEKAAALPDASSVSACLLKAAAAQPERTLPAANSEAGLLLNRVRWLATALPELHLPDLSDSGLFAFLPDLVPGCRSFAELRAGPWSSIVLSRLAPLQRQTLEREAPPRYRLPNGQTAAIVYDPGRPPIIASRIQDFFGLAETPRFARGKVKALLHLLAPNGRPQQVTDDLASFWANTYAVVRKELRGRYPKHKWPEDPRVMLSAP